MNAVPLGASESRALRDKLTDRREVLRDEIHSALREVTASNPKDLAGPVYDLKDESLGQMLRDVRLADMHRDIQELLDIDAALQRIQASRYGLCMDCGEPIPLARLRVYPTAKRCRPCQEIHERQRSAMR